MIFLDFWRAGGRRGSASECSRATEEGRIRA
jgi:hypothetical protein